MSSATTGICVVLAFCLTGTLSCAAQKADFVRPRQPTYVSFTVPKSTGTFPTCINNLLTVAGYYKIGNNGRSEGFVRDISGKIQTFKAGSLLTQAEAINDSGEIAGVYQDVSGVQRGFVRSPKGVITTFNPGGDAGNTTPTGIDDNGLVTGYYSTGNSSPPTFGFVRYPDGGIVTFNATRDTDYTTSSGMNNQGASMGAYFYDGDTQVGGFVRSPDGYVTTFKYQQGIVPTSINAGGTTVGWYDPAAAGATFRGFIRSADGKITPFALPGEIGTQYISINRASEVTGSYTEQNSATIQSHEPSEIVHGFLRCSYGQILSFDIPGPGVFTTMPSDINDLGVVTGTYQPQSGYLTGFLRIPVPDRI
jgi:hypothetical protein